MFNNLKKYNVILASNSPRRKELFGQLGIDFTIKTVEGIDETYPQQLKGADVALHIASQKAKAYEDILGDNDLVITADTIVCVDDEILGKPVDAADARRMLMLLSGRQHDVVTAVVVKAKTKTVEFAATTHVTFAKLSDEVIDFYITNYRPFDKAGAYGIQEWIGYVGVEAVEGSFFNVIGLPVQRLVQILQEF